MLKIVPAVIATALIGLVSTNVIAQGSGYHNRPATNVIIVNDAHCDHHHPGNKKYKKAKHPHKHKGYRHSRPVAHPPLVIVDTRHLPIRRYSNNRYYYRTQAGLHYWLGRNGHLYLDVKFVQPGARNSRDYAIWERGRM